MRLEMHLSDCLMCQDLIRNRAQSRQQAKGLNTKLDSLETVAQSHHVKASTKVDSIRSGIEQLSVRGSNNAREAKERDLQFAAGQKAQTEMLAVLLAQQQAQFAQLQQQFMTNTSDSPTTPQNPSTKAEQLRELTSQVKYDPLDALRTWYEGSTIIESYTTKHDIAVLETLEED